MPGDGHRRPKNNGKKPEEDNDQRDWMGNDFDQSISRAPKNGHGSQPNKQREFAAYAISERLNALQLVVWPRLSRHAREHIGCARAVQFVMIRLRPLHSSLGFGARGFAISMPRSPTEFSAVSG